MTDPVSAITEASATGTVAATFADIRATTRVGVVNLIWRHLATIPGALDWAWGAVRPRYADGTLAEAADTLRASLTLPSLARLPPPHADAAAILAAYDRTNIRALLALCALRAQVHGRCPVRPAWRSLICPCRRCRHWTRWRRRSRPWCWR